MFDICPKRTRALTWRAAATDTTGATAVRLRRGTAVGTVAATIVLIIVAGITAGFWLNLVMWIPMLIVGAFMDEYSGLPVVTLLSMIVAMAVVFVVGLLALGLPWYAAGIAGVVVGLTSYARPNPAAQVDW